MSARARRKAEPGGAGGWWASARLGGLLQLALALYLVLSLTGPAVAWWQVLQGSPFPDLPGPTNPGGPVGALAALLLRGIFGAAWAWAVPLLLALSGVAALGGRSGPAGRLALRLLLPWLATAGWLAQPQGPLGEPAGAIWGGVAGLWLGGGFQALFGAWGARIFLTFLVIMTLAASAGSRVRLLAPLLRAGGALARGLVAGAAAIGRGTGGLIAGAARGGTAALAAAGARVLAPVRALGVRGAAPSSAEEAAAGAGPARPRRVHGSALPAGAGSAAAIAAVPPAAVGGSAALAAGGSPAVAVATATAATATAAVSTAAGRDPDGRIPRPQPRREPAAWELPPLTMLRDPDPDASATTPAALDAAADRLEDTLRSFGVQGEVKDVRPGPVVTTFEYQPAAGIRVSQITQRANDLALAMKARSLRMEAPIPGKAAVGIEIPNPRPRVVRLKETLLAAGPRPRPPLSIGLGTDVVGQPVFIDIASLPHLLVAGSTGSGKSVCLNAIICNLLLRNDPSRVRLLLIDPKMLEMSVYNGLPHLLLPVVTDPREALKAMKWMLEQMDRRYRRLARAGVRNIEVYNERVARGEVREADGETPAEPMPYYVTVVDELADLMIQLGQDFELPITRLAAKARAVGIHLILATQRPSVDVLTGVIKANIPCRIAFRVIQRNDSRTILDLNGAESLLGHGDLLYLQPGRAQPVRVQCALIELEECEAIVAHWRRFEGLAEPVCLEDEEGESAGGYTGEDDLFEDAKRVVVLHQSGSTSLLQRRLRIGYTRAGRLMDMLEEAGVVGPFTGSKARDVLMRPEELGETGPLSDEDEA